MEVIVAETAGFCFGVKRAVNTASSLSEEKVEKIFTLGPIVHNENVIHSLEEKNVFVSDLEGLEKNPKSTVVIRAHGIPEKVENQLNEKGFNVVDATCPFVKKIHRIVSQNSAEGRKIIVVGDPKHPEVVGIVGWCSGPCYVVQDVNDVEKLGISLKEKLCIVSQTTFNNEKFKNIVEIIENKGYNCFIVNTICNATKERQQEAGQIAASVDAMIVIGSAASSNSQKLYEICKERCESTYFIQTVNDLKTSMFESKSKVGITAGASTPDNIIEEVQTYVREF